MISVRRRRAVPSDKTGDNLLAGGAPGSVEVRPRILRVGDDYAATFVVTGYPAEVGPGWLEPLLFLPGRLDVAVHIDPLRRPVLIVTAISPGERGERAARRHADATVRALSRIGVTTRALDGYAATAALAAAADPYRLPGPGGLAVRTPTAPPARRAKSRRTPS